MLPKFRTLPEWADFFGNRISVQSLRREVRTGRLRAIRARPGCNSRILISEAEIKRWIDDYASKRQWVISPSEAARINREAGE